jgi:predicted TIM-barrel enzyme
VNTEPPITLSPGQAEAVDLIQSGENVFLSGMAGTGKSTALLQYIGQAFRRVDVCATTGIAALNLQDQFRMNAGVGIAATATCGARTPSAGTQPATYRRSATWTA